MSTEDMVEDLIQISMKAYKKNSRGCREWDCLSRHTPVIIQGVEFAYWREYAVYKVCEYLKEKCPEAIVDCYLEGNNSNIRLELTDEQQKKLNSIMYNFLKSL